MADEIKYIGEQLRALRLYHGLIQMAYLMSKLIVLSLTIFRGS